MNKIVALCFLLLPLLSHALELTYHLSMPQPNSHYFAVKIDVKGNTANTQEFKLPVWTPGSYLVREFSKNLNQVKAIDINNKELVVNKKTKNAWEIQCAGQENFTIFYEVYAFELSVRTPYLDNTHGFVAGAAVFMYTEATKNQRGLLKVYPHQSFKKVSTALPSADFKTELGCFNFTFEDYD